MKIESFHLYKLELPLRVPYKLAFGTVMAFDTLIAETRSDDQRRAFGEATVLPGYTDETVEGSWRLMGETAARLVGLGGTDAKALAAEKIHDGPFAMTALITAIEALEDNPHLAVRAATPVPLLAVLNGMGGPEMEAEIDRHVAGGYGTIKVKVGFDADADSARVRAIQKYLKNRAMIRLDGNQGYNTADAVRFAGSLDPDGIELFEQPCAAGDWDAAVAVAKVATVPMMLDESIYGLEDIERAAELKAAKFVKLKLMKMGGLDALAHGLDRIRELGMTPVLGNGVASDVGCWMEACVARGRVDNAGEMNGFLKPRQTLFEKPIAVEKGAMVLAPGPMPQPDAKVLATAKARADFKAS